MLTSHSGPHRIHTFESGHRSIEIGPHRRDVQSPAAGPGALNKADCHSIARRPQSSRRGGGHGMYAHVHVLARRSKVWGIDNHQLHAWSHEKARQDEGRIPQPDQRVDRPAPILVSGWETGGGSLIALSRV